MNVIKEVEEFLLNRYINLQYDDKVNSNDIYLMQKLIDLVSKNANENDESRQPLLQRKRKFENTDRNYGVKQKKQKVANDDDLRDVVNDDVNYNVLNDDVMNDDVMNDDDVRSLHVETVPLLSESDFKNDVMVSVTDAYDDIATDDDDIATDEDDVSSFVTQIRIPSEDEKITIIFPSDNFKKFVEDLEFSFGDNHPALSWNQIELQFLDDCDSDYYMKIFDNAIILDAGFVLRLMLEHPESNLNVRNVLSVMKKAIRLCDTNADYVVDHYLRHNDFSETDVISLFRSVLKYKRACALNVLINHYRSTIDLLEIYSLYLASGGDKRSKKYIDDLLYCNNADMIRAFVEESGLTVTWDLCITYLQMSIGYFNANDTFNIDFKTFKFLFNSAEINELLTREIKNTLLDYARQNIGDECFDVVSYLLDEPTDYDDDEKKKIVVNMTTNRILNNKTKYGFRRQIYNA